MHNKNRPYCAFTGGLSQGDCPPVSSECENRANMIIRTTTVSSTLFRYTILISVFTCMFIKYSWPTITIQS